MAKARRRIRPTRGQASALIRRDRLPVRSTRLDLLAGTALAALVGCGLFTFGAPAVAQVSGVRGGTVVAGEATIRNTAPGHVTVTQSTNRGVIDWRSFSIDAGERVDFLQPGTSSVTLNRVTGPDPSVIAGRLTATGQLILVNGAGVVFANGAQINAAGLVASTANVVDPQRFMQGGTVAFDRPSADPNAAVVNAGTITVREGGLVGLVGNAAANSGTINARLGRVVIGGAETFTVDLAGDGLINFQLGKPVTRQPLDAEGNKRPLAANTGTINADGGSVMITARAARGVVDSVVNAGGTINARAVRDEGGVVVFGADEGTLNVTGKVDVSGTAPGQRGGQVVARAAQGKVNVAATARIDASGASGGGKVLIGGSKQGQGPVASARDTKVAPGAVINADATGKGDGGTVIVWADNATVFGGTVSAKGGPQGGNGGFVETSGKDTLTITKGASVAVGASTGAAGLWLLDPANVTIDSAAATSIAATLTGGGNVTIDTNADPDPGEAGNITLAANIAAANLSANVTLTLQAHGKIDLGAKSITLTPLTGKTATVVLDTATLGGTATDHSISSTGGKISATNLTLDADIAGGTIALAGEINVTRLNFKSAGAVTIGNTDNSIVNIATTASTAGGDVTIVSARDTTIASGGIAAGSSAITISTVGTGNTIILSGSLAGDTITLSSASRLVGEGAISATGAVSLKAEGTQSFDGISGINLTGTITGTGVTVESAADVTLSGADNAFGTFSTIGTIGGAITVTHKGDLTINATDAGSNTASFTTTDGGNITVAGALTAGDGITLNAAGAVQVQAAVSTGDGDVTISATSVGQTAAGVITANGLAVTASGDVDLTQAASDIGVFAVDTTGNVGLLEADGFSIGSVGALDGATVGGNLQIDTGGGITQSQPISAGALAVRATGFVDLTSDANTIGTFAASVTDASVGLRVDGDLSIGSVAAVGKLATLDGVTTTGTGAASFKASGSVTQTKAISAAGGLAVVTTGGDILLDGASNATATVAFDASGNVSYKASTTFSIGEVPETGTLEAVIGLTTPGTAVLTATGATAGIAQTRAIDAATLDINTAGGGDVTLTNGSNLITTVRSSAGLGTGPTEVTDSAGGLNLAAMTAGGPVTITASSGLTVTGNVTTAGKHLTLTSKSGAVTVNAALDVGTATVALKSGGLGNITATAGAITAGVLTLQTGSAGGATVQTAKHNVATVQTAGTGVGSGGLTFKQERSLGLSVGSVLSAGAVAINEGVGSLTVVGKIDTGAGNANVTLAASAGTVAINNQIDAGGGQVALLAQQAITQAGSGAGITASGLRAENLSGDISLNPTGTLAADVNAVTTVAAKAGAGSVLYTSAGTFDIGTVGTTVGITSTGAVTLSVTNAGATITQSDGAAGRISTGTLNIAANGGDVTIDNDTNSIAALGSVNLGSGAFVFVNSAAGPLDVGAIIANGGIDITNKGGNLTTSAAITSDGDIALTSSTGLIQLGGAVTSNGGGVTLHSSGNLDTGPFAISAASGDVTLVSDAGTVTIGAGGVTVGDTLAIQIGAGLTLTVGGTITAPSVTLVADQMEILAPISAGGTISLAPVTAGRAVTIGTSGAPVGLVIDNAELSNLSSAATLTIGKNAFGDTTAGAIQVGAASITSNTLNLFATAGIAQVGALSVGASGTGALNITAGGTVSLDGFGNQIGTVGGSTTAGNFSILRSSATASALTVQAITTAGGDIAVRNFDGNLVVAGAQTSKGGRIALGSNDSAGSTLSVNAAVNAGTGGVYLFASGGISQTSSGVITATGLAVRNFLTGNISLLADNAAGGNVVLQTAGSSIAFRNTSDFVVGGVPSSFTVAGLNFVIPGPGIMTAAGGTTTLSIGGDVTQAAGAASTIQTGTLTIGRLAGAHPDVTLDNPGNVVSALGAVSLGQGAFSFVNTGDLAILGAGSAGGGYSVTTAGALTQGSGAAIDTSETTSGGSSDGTISLTSTGGFLNIVLNGNLDAGTSGTVALTSGGNVIQSAGAITASAVTATASGVISLTSGTNAFGAISGAGASGFSATTTRALTIGTAGISSSAGSVTLTANGGTSDITVNDQISAAGTVSLIAGGDILQTAGGGISAASLRAVASAGSVDLSGGTNDVATIAGSASGDFHYVDGAGALTIGTVAGTVGVTSTNGDVTIEATGGTMNVASTVVATSADGDITLRAAGNLSVAAALTASSSTGRVTVRSLGGSVVESAGGVISAAELLALAETNIDIAQSGNTVGASGFAARADTGFVVFINGGAIELDEVGILNGVTAGGAVVIATTTGNVSQTANGIITAGAGLGLAVPGGSIILDQANLISGNVAVVNTGGGSVTIRNTGNINIGTVGPIATAGTSVPQLNGITASTAAGKFVSLISDTGTVTQSAGVANRILGGELRATTNNRNVTLGNTANEFTKVGNVNLGDGQLTVYDSKDGLELSSPVVANGGVILTTQGTFTLPGSITVANGDISLRSLGSGITLSSTLSATSGQVRLDADGGSIAQSGGTISAGSLLATASGSVTISGTLSVANGLVQLDATGGIIEQAGGTITAESLIARAAGNVQLAQSGNAVGTIAGSSSTGGFSYSGKTGVAIGKLLDAAGASVSGITTKAGTGTVRLEVAEGDVTQVGGAPITAGSLLVKAPGGSVLLGTVVNTVTNVTGSAADGFNIQTSGALVVAGTGIDAGGNITLTSTQGSISQAADAPIIGDRVHATANAAGASVTLNAADNAFASISGSSSGDFSATTSQSLTVASGGVSSASGSIRLVASGSGSDIAVTDDLEASAGTVSLIAGRSITDTSAGGIVAASLRAVASTGSVDLSHAAAANRVATIAGSAAGDFAYASNGGGALTVGTVTTTGVTSTGGDVALAAGGDLRLAAAVRADAGSGTVSLTSTGGSITSVSADGLVAGNRGVFQAASNVDLARAGNAVGAGGLAGASESGFFVLFSGTALHVDSVSGVSGITSKGATILRAGAGNITQAGGTDGRITAGGGLGVLANAGNVVLDQANAVSGDFFADAAGSLTFRNSGSIRIGELAVTSASGGAIGGNGITASVASRRFISLTSDSGTIGQDGASGSAIVGNELRASTTDRNVTLANTGNRLDVVGAVDLGAGAFTLFDSAGGLVASGPISANGGVDLTTQGTLTLPGSIAVATGDISLQSLGSGITLGSALSAVNGQVQIDAGGTGSIVQTGGSITARTLIARAPGDVELTRAGNDAGTIAGWSTAGTFRYRDKTAIAIGAPGVATKANGDITLVAGAGGSSGGIAVNGAVDAGTGTVRLQTARGNITQAADAPITATSLLANALGGSVLLGDSTNHVTNVAASALASTFELTTSGSVVVTTVAGDSLTATGTGIVVNNGDITLRSGGAIVLSARVNAANGNAAGDPAAGSIALIAGSGSISQSATAVVVGSSLLARASGRVDLDASGNHVVRLSGRAGSGTFRFRNADALVVGGIATSNADIGIHAGGDLTLDGAVDANTAVVRLQATGGHITQGTDGRIVGGTLLANTVGRGDVVLTNPANFLRDGAAGRPGFVAGRAAGNFRVVNGNDLTVTDAPVGGDAGLDIAGATGVRAGTGRLVDLGVSAGDLSIQGPVSANAGMIVYRRLAGAPVGDIIVGGDSGNPGNDTGGAWLLIVDLTGSSSVALTGLAESGPGSTGAPGGLFKGPTPPTLLRPSGLGGPNAGGNMVIGGLNGIDSTVYLAGGGTSFISSTAPGHFGVLGVYAPEGARVNLQSIVRAIPNSVPWPIGPFGPNAPGPVGSPPDAVARDFVRKGGLPSINQRFNNCVIAGPSCTTIFTQVANPPAAADDAVIGVSGSSLDDSSIVLVNQGNEDFIEEDEDDDAERRNDAGASP